MNLNPAFEFQFIYILDNAVLAWGLAACGLAQFSKLLFELIFKQRWRPSVLIETGGMPSSHSALVTGTAAGIGLQLGFNDPVFALASTIAFIVMYDASGIRRSAGLTGTVAKVAAGAFEHLPVTRVVNLNRALEELKKNGFIVVGLSGDGQTSISMFNEKTPLVVIVGSEDKGISLLTQKKCDFLLRIPLKGKTSSLNASVAAAVSLFHLTGK